ncbi:hypothetical protein BGZ83_002983 [Gryganskiella cystojenkinii]|nr:hypothetical protein BGZ83_002983 [Gryganskiella cystojenkinii]
MGHEINAMARAFLELPAVQNEDEVQRPQTDQDIDREAESESTTAGGVNDVTLLQLFTDQVKTNLSRGDNKDFKRLLQNQMDQANVCRLSKKEVLGNGKGRALRGEGIYERSLSPYPVYLELKANRPVDYNHNYDWMSPMSPIRNVSDELNLEFIKLKNRLQRVMLRTPTDEKSAEKRTRLIHYYKGRLVAMDRCFSVPLDIKNLRCNWCGGKVPPVSKDFELQFARLDVDVAECGALLKEKRRFQSLYELTAIPQPTGCSHCGIRFSSHFSPAFGRIGQTCLECTDSHTSLGSYPEPPPVTPEGFQELLGAVIDSTDDQGIHWDRVANHAKANPNFQYTAQGIHSRWLHHIKQPDTPYYQTYILLQHNHLTRRSQDWELYTCRAESPTHAALYFARFVALYKKRPMTYLYIRQLEEWNIPPPRSDDWEDLSYGLLTFDQLKSRIQENLLKASYDQDPESTELATLETKLESIRKANLRKLRPSGQIVNLNPEKNNAHTLWVDRMKDEFGPSNAHLMNQLIWDDEEDFRNRVEFQQYLPLMIEKSIKIKQRIWYTKSLKERRRMRSALPTYHGRHWTIKDMEYDLRTHYRLFHAMFMRNLEAREGVVKGVLGHIALDCPETRATHMPLWALENARSVIRHTAADNRLRRIHERHNMYKRYQTLTILRRRKPEESRLSLNTIKKQSIKRLKNDISQFSAARDGESRRRPEDCDAIARNVGRITASQGAQKLQFEKVPLGTLTDSPAEFLNPVRFPNAMRQRLGPRRVRLSAAQKLFLEQQVEGASRADVPAEIERGPTIKVNFKPLYKDGKLPRAFAQRQDLPDAFNDTPTPSADYPIHLLPQEYQVHVFQSLLTSESRTAHVRLVRSERYKRQGDSVQGGGPVQLPKVISVENTRGFYRDSNRSVRSKSSRMDSDPVVLLRSKPDSEVDHRGVETWQQLEDLLEHSDNESEDDDAGNGEKGNGGKRRKEEEEGGEKSRKKLGRNVPRLQVDQVDLKAGEGLDEYQGALHRIHYETVMNESVVLDEVQAARRAMEKKNEDILENSIVEEDREVVKPVVLRKLAAHGKLDQYLPKAAPESDSDLSLHLDSSTDLDSDLDSDSDSDSSSNADMVSDSARATASTSAMKDDKDPEIKNTLINTLIRRELLKYQSVAQSIINESQESEPELEPPRKFRINTDRDGEMDALSERSETTPKQRPRKKRATQEAVVSEHDQDQDHDSDHDSEVDIDRDDAMSE